MYIGTLAPATGGWWHDMIADGSHGSTYVQALQGDPDSWDSWHTIRKANPLTAISADFRKKLLQERDAARRDYSSESSIHELPSERPERG